MPDTCPNRNRLPVLLSGDLPADELHDLEEHVTECRECELALSGLVSRADEDWAQWKPLLPADTKVSQDTKPESLSQVDSSQLSMQLEAAGFERVIERGRGGMGVVFSAWQPQMQRDVAIKLLLGGVLAGPERTQRLLIEAQATGKLNHANVVQIFDVIDINGIPGLVLEFVEGPSLAQKLVDGPIEPALAASYASSIAAGLQHAHCNGILHRDIKPANVLLSSTCEDALPKVADFGLAKNVDNAMSLTGEALVGTPSYMAPEQVSGAVELDARVDVYAVGAILYEMLCGSPPLLGASPAQVFLMIAEQIPVPPRQLQPTVPKDLETICLKCLEKSPRARYATAQALQDDIELFRSGRPISARRATWLQRGVKWCTRNPALATSVATLAIAITIALGIWATMTAQLGAVNDRLLDSNGELKIAVAELGEERESLLGQIAATKALRGFLLQDLLGKASVRYQLRQAEELGEKEEVFVDPTIRELVLQTAEQLRGDGLQEQFPSQPQAQYEVLTVVGELLADLGEYRAATEFLERSLEVLPDVEQEVAEEKLTSLLSLSSRYVSLGRLDETLEVATFVLNQINGRPLSFIHCAAENNIAIAHMGRNESELAFLHSLRAYEGYAEVLGVEHEQTLLAAGTHAQVLQELHRDVEAAELLQKTLDTAVETLPPEHPRIMSLLQKLSSVLLDLGESDNAVALLADAHERSVSVYGADHPKTAMCQANLGNALFRTERREAAFRNLEEGIAILTDKLGEDHPFVMAASKKLSRERAKDSSD